MLWQLYRQACRADPSDPEGVVTEMQCACDQMRTSYRAAAAAGAANNPAASSRLTMLTYIHTVLDILGGDWTSHKKGTQMAVFSFC